MTQKKDAEVLMQTNAKKVHMYQTEFEMNQKIFLQAVTDIHKLDQKVSVLRRTNGAEALVQKEVEVEVVDSTESSIDAAKTAERLRDHNKVLEDENLHWHDTVSEDSSLLW